MCVINNDYVFDDSVVGFIFVVVYIPGQYGLYGAWSAPPPPPPPLACVPLQWLSCSILCMQARIQDSEGGGFVQGFRLENRSYPDVHDFSLRMQVIIAND